MENPLHKAQSNRSPKLTLFDSRLPKSTTREQSICGLLVHPKTRGVNRLGGEVSHVINTLPVSIYGPYFHSTLTPPLL